MDYDLKDLNVSADSQDHSRSAGLSSPTHYFQTALKGAEFLQDSGYQSVLERSAHPFSSSIVDDILSEGSDAANDEDWGEWRF